MNMKKKIFNSLIFGLILAGCNRGSKEIKSSPITDVKSKLISITQKIINQKDNSDSKVLLTELSNNYPKKYTCSIFPDGILKGDINRDGFEDVLFRYTVDDVENQTWVACGWFIAFSNSKNEYDKYIYFDWSSGPCAQSQFDLGFPKSILDGVISSNIDDYDTDDGCCCPSIKRTMKFTYEKEFNFLSLLKIETTKQ